MKVSKYGLNIMRRMRASTGKYSSSGAGETINRDEGTRLLCGLDGLLSFSGRLSLAEWKGTWLCSHADTLMWAVRLRVEA